MFFHPFFNPIYERDLNGPFEDIVGKNSIKWKFIKYDEIYINLHLLI